MPAKLTVPAGLFPDRRNRKFADSSLEEAGFEPSVPRKTPAVVVISALVAPPSPLRQAEPTRAPLSKPGPSHAALTVRSGLFQRWVRRTLRLRS